MLLASINKNASGLMTQTFEGHSIALLSTEVCYCISNARIHEVHTTGLNKGEVVSSAIFYFT